jgi:hypothetical protein
MALSVAQQRQPMRVTAERGLLSRHEVSQQYDLAIWKLQRIVMGVRIVEADLAETAVLWWTTLFDQGQGRSR